MDNLVVPRLWRANSPQICGEPQVGAMYSNTGGATETHGSRSKGSRTRSGRPSEAFLRAVETVRRSAETFQKPLEALGRPSRASRNDEGRPEDCVRVRPGRPSGAVQRM